MPVDLGAGAENDLDEIPMLMRAKDGGCVIMNPYSDSQLLSRISQLLKMPINQFKFRSQD